MSEEYINQITIDCLMNKEQYKNCLKNTSKGINKNDKKFYRKRIYNLAKELLLSKEEPTNLFPDVKYSFDNFIKNCIHYFKSLDNNDIIQDEYKKFQNEFNTETEEINTEEIKTEKINTEKINTEEINTEEIDKNFIRSINLPKPSLNNFVKKNKIIVPQIIIPQQKEINLKEPSLRIKGIINSDKKKNINNKYDEYNKKKENDESNTTIKK